ncbi:MAG: hypothetical protein HRT94_04875 [Alphaproteobacteria bacterium]|nr:hypothetical protein [Alphaproteobacteria bacterium]
MGKITKDNAINQKQGRACRVAYSLNNMQPVECTIISDQPFFYMDEEILIEDDEGILCDEFEISAEFDAELKALRSKIDSYDRFSLEFSQPRDKALQDFITQSAFLGQACSDEQSIIDEQRVIINKSRYALGLLNFAEQHNVELKISSHVDSVYYDRDGSQILINPQLEKVSCTFGLVRALRQHWQHRHGTLVHPLSFHPDHAILVNRAQLADLSVAIIRSAWELKLADDKEFWAKIENSDLSDLGRAFAREALIDFRTLNNGKASAAVFETWFLSERCSHQDKLLIQKMLSDYKGYTFNHIETSKLVSIDLICALGEQPFGKNYLASYAQMILNDPVFIDVRDRSNANFLWFIKFERSFNEVEQELQTSSSDQVSDQKRDVHHAFFNQDEKVTERSGTNLTKGQENEEDTRYDTNVIEINFAAHRSEPEQQKS